MTKGYLLKTAVALSMLLSISLAQENVDAIEKARQAKEAADKAAAEAAAATEAAIEAAAAKAAKEAREEAKRKKEEEEARKIAEAKAAEEAELDAAAAAAAEEAKRKMAAELGLEVESSETDSKDVEGSEVEEEAVSESSVAEGPAEDVIAKEATGWSVGLSGSVGLINGEYILNTPVGGSLVVTTPYNLKLGAFDLEVSLALGSYSGETPNSSDYSPTVFGVGGNLTLFNFLFYEGHVGLVGAGPGGRGFGGVTLERLLKNNLNLPFNLLVGAEGFLSTKLEDSGDEASYWGGLGVRLDYSF